jgi:hypothetical protein
MNLCVHHLPVKHMAAKTRNIAFRFNMQGKLKLKNQYQIYHRTNNYAWKMYINQEIE